MHLKYLSCWMPPSSSLLMLILWQTVTDCDIWVNCIMYSLKNASSLSRSWIRTDTLDVRLCGWDVSRICVNIACCMTNRERHAHIISSSAIVYFGMKFAMANANEGRLGSWGAHGRQPSPWEEDGLPHICGREKAWYTTANASQHYSNMIYGLSFLKMEEKAELEGSDFKPFQWGRNYDLYLAGKQRPMW